MRPSLFLLLAACHGGGTSVPRDPPPAGDSSPQDTGVAGAAESIPDNTDEYGCPEVFHQDRLPSFDLEVSPQSWAALESDYASGSKTYHPATFVYRPEQGEEIRIEDAAVRLRGNPGFSWLGDKMQFNVSFNEYDPDGRFQGLRKIALDAAWYDPTLLRDRLAYAYMRRAGVPAPCANNARLSINGEYYGLYKNIEFVDQELLERNFGDANAQGALWKYGTELTANEEAAIPGLVDTFWSTTEVSWLQEHSDLEANVREWATEVVTPHNDGYWCCAHNFYLYEHPERGLLFLPWDLDYSFTDTPYYADPYTWYRGSDAAHFDAVAAHPEWGRRFLEILRETTEAYDPAWLEEQVEAWADQIHESVEEDPHTNISLGEHEGAVERLRAYVYARQAWLLAWLDCQEGDLTDDDGDGYGPCEDCDDGDPDAHPGATETCNHRDTDCNGFLDDSEHCDTCYEHAFGDSRMLVCGYPRTWSAARAECQAHGADLGYPRTTEDWYVIYIHTYWHYHYFAGIYYWWVGATDAAQEGVWVDPEGASVAAWAAWASGEPSGGRAENCAVLSPNNWAWYDAACGSERPAICRIE